MIRYLALALVAVGCSRAPAPPPVVDDLPPPNPVVPADSDDARACATLVRLGCPEGAPTRGTCLAVFSAAHTDSIVTPSRCIADAPDILAVRRCGDASTLTITCTR